LDGGAGHFAETIKKIKEQSNDKILVECLTGDFGGNLKGVETVMKSGPDVYAHNLETVERLTPSVRDHRATYRQSLKILEHAKSQKSSKSGPSPFFTKSSLMLGCGETITEVIQSMKDLRSIEVDLLTIGQYMRPTKKHMKVEEYIKPEIFKFLEEEGKVLGFKYVASGPLVRSSYRAGELFIKTLFNKI
jgi:lipoyl synthase